MKNPINKILLLSSILFIQNSYAVFTWTGATTGPNGSVTFTGGLDNWTGDGQTRTGVSTTTNPDADELIRDFSSGTLNLTLLDQARLASTPGTPFTANLQFELFGGVNRNADLYLNNRNPFDGGSGTWDGISLSDFSGGVNRIEMTVTYSSPVATRNYASLDNSRPIGSGLAIDDLGGTTLASYEITSELFGVVSDPTNTDNFVSGLSAGFDTPVLINGLTGAAGSTIANASAFSGLDQFLIVRGYDNNGNVASYNPTFKDRTYITTQKWTITRDGGADFARDSSFVFSLDGAQYDNYLDAAAVPEPSVIFSAIGGFSFFLIRRSKRKIA